MPESQTSKINVNTFITGMIILLAVVGFGVMRVRSTAEFRREAAEARKAETERDDRIIELLKEQNQRLQGLQDCFNEPQQKAPQRPAKGPRKQAQSYEVADGVLPIGKGN